MIFRNRELFGLGLIMLTVLSFYHYAANTPSYRFLLSIFTPANEQKYPRDSITNYNGKVNDKLLMFLQTIMVLTLLLACKVVYQRIKNRHSNDYSKSKGVQ